MLGVALLAAATVSTGVLAGAFLLYAHTVMPALRRAPDAEFVATFRRIDTAIINPAFMATGFVGAPVLTLAAVFAGTAQVRPWVLVALGLHLLMVLLTVTINVPRNNALKAAAPDADPAAVRASFDEIRWASSNLLRVVLTLGATGLLAWALVVAGTQR